MRYVYMMSFLVEWNASAVYFLVSLWDFALIFGLAGYCFVRALNSRCGMNLSSQTFQLYNQSIEYQHSESISAVVNRVLQWSCRRKPITHFTWNWMWHWFWRKLSSGYQDEWCTIYNCSSIYIIVHNTPNHQPHILASLHSVCCRNSRKSDVNRVRARLNMLCIRPTPKSKQIISYQINTISSYVRKSALQTDTNKMHRFCASKREDIETERQRKK